MSVTRAAVVAGLTISLSVIVASGSVACRFPHCRDATLLDGECRRSGGTFDVDECACIGARRFEPPQVARDEPSGAPCAGDAECASGTCQDTDECVGSSCDRAGDCTCSTVVRRCTGDLLDGG